MNRAHVSTQRTRTRLPDYPIIKHHHHHHHQQQYTNDTPTAAAPPLVPGPYIPAPSLRHLLPTHIHLHPDDEPDHILAITFAILQRAANRAMSVKELGEAAYVQGYLRTSPSAAGQAIGTHIRNHTARHADAPTNALLASYRLVGGLEDIRVANALYCSTPGTCRKGTTVWYLSSATGVPCPFEQGAACAAPGQGPGTGSIFTSASTPAGPTLKRKIPPDDSAELQRPNKIRITLRLPARTPIPPRPRPVLPPTVARGITTIASSSSTSSSSDSSEEDDSSSSNDSDSDENMLDDFSSLLATDLPISIPCAHRDPRRRPSILTSAFSQSSLPFFDTCEPPPDSEDEDEDFHNSMLRGAEPPGQRHAHGHGEDGWRCKEEEVDIKEEDLAAIVLHELALSTAHSTESPEPLGHSVGEGGSTAQRQGPPQGQQPRRQDQLGGVIENKDEDVALPIALKLEEEAVVGPMDLFSPTGPGSPSSCALDADGSRGVSSPTPYPPFDRGTPYDRTGPTTRRGTSTLSVPPPTPWIKTEDESFMFERHLSPEDDVSVSLDGLEVDNLDVGVDNLDSLDVDLESPLMSAIPISSVRPWEYLHDWASLGTATGVAMGGMGMGMGTRTASVSTDDVDVDFDSFESDRIKPSTSAPLFPLPPRGEGAGAGGRKPLRLSTGNTTPFPSGQHHQPGHARRHSHAAFATTHARSNRDRRLSIISSTISNTATAFSDWTSGTPEDPDAPLVTPSHTGWRTYQCWPVALKNGNGSGSTPAHERIEEGAGVEEVRDGANGTVDGEKETNPPQVVHDDRPDPLSPSNEEELNSMLMAPSFNQVLSKSLPPNHPISTLLLLGIPVFQCRLDSPPMELIRRIDTDYVNISSIILYARYLAQAAPTSRSRSSNAHNNSNQSTKPTLPPPPTADELPSNHVFISSGARVINGGWVPLHTARSLVKNYHDLPPFIRRVFLSDSLAEKFPPPISYVRSLLISCREKHKANAATAGGGAVSAFGKPFAKPSSLSAHELLVHVGSHALASAGGSNGILASSTVISDAKGPVTTRGIPLALSMSGTGFSPHSFPLSPVAALSSANALRAKTAQQQQQSPGNGGSMQSLMAFTTGTPLLSSPLNGWSIGLGKSAVERSETPLKPEEEEMLNAILKTPPKARSAPGTAVSASPPRGGGDRFEDEGMSVDEREEEEVVREVVDIGSEEEQEEEQVDDTVRLTRNAASKRATKQQHTVVPRRSLRRMRSISSISSELTVSESESSAPPPSLDSRPALKEGKSTNHSAARAPAAAPAVAAPTTVNGRRKRNGGGGGGGDIAVVASVPLPARSQPDAAKKVKIIEIDEPVDLGKPRRSIRTAKSDPTSTSQAVPAPLAPAAPRTSQAQVASPSGVKATGGGNAEKAPTTKPRRSIAVVEKEAEKDGPVLTRAGAAAAQRNAKRTLRSRA